MDKYILLDLKQNIYTCQGRLICRSFVVVHTSSLFGTQHWCCWAELFSASATPFNTIKLPLPLVHHHMTKKFLMRAPWKNFWVFHHMAIRHIHGIQWSQVQEQHITDDEVWARLLNMWNVDTFIIRHVNKCIGKAIRAQYNATNKQLIGACTFCPCKIERPQNSCYSTTISSPRSKQSSWQPLRSGCHLQGKRKPGTLKSTIMS